MLAGILAKPKACGAGRRRMLRLRAAAATLKPDLPLPALAPCAAPAPCHSVTAGSGSRNKARPSARRPCERRPLRPANHDPCPAHCRAGKRAGVSGRAGYEFFSVAAFLW